MSYNKIPTNKPERRALLARAREEAEIHKKEKFDQEWGYTWIDSPLGPSDVRSVSDVEYDATFASLLGNMTLPEFILEHFGNRRRSGGVVMADWGGPGRRVARNIASLGEHTSQGRLGIKKSFGGTLKDIGSEEEKTADRVNNHTVAEGNLLDAEMDEKLKTWLGEDTVDVFFCRMAKGLETIPLEPYTLGRKLQTAYATLSPDGVMFFQVPFELRSLVEAWGMVLQKEYAGKLEVVVRSGKSDTREPYTAAIKIRKLPEAPRELPLLNARLVTKIAIDTKKKRKW